jgi:hypothetical protein
MQAVVGGLLLSRLVYRLARILFFGPMRENEAQTEIIALVAAVITAIYGYFILYAELDRVLMRQGIQFIAVGHRPPSVYHRAERTIGSFRRALHRSAPAHLGHGAPLAAGRCGPPSLCGHRRGGPGEEGVVSGWQTAAS